MLNDTFEWDGGDWTPLSLVPNVPPGRWGAPAVSVCGPVFMIGGSMTSATPYLNDQWMWNGSTWSATSFADGGAPPARFLASAATLNGVVILFGGYANSVESSDTWINRGDAWSQATYPADSGPGARVEAAMFTLNDQVVLYGGSTDQGNTVLQDTWIWNGADWTEKSPMHNPGPRYGTAAVTFGTVGLVFGGYDENSNYTDETWLWDGGDWTNVTPDAGPDAGPPARARAAAATLGNRVLLFGGQGDPGPLGDAWVWDGTSWTPLPPSPNQPSARYSSSIAVY
jgi:hypothetical protein